MKFLLIYNKHEDVVDVYQVDNVSEDLLNAIITCVHCGLGMHPNFNKFYKESLENIPMVNELGKIMQLNERHPCAICTEYEKKADEL